MTQENPPPTVHARNLSCMPHAHNPRYPIPDRSDFTPNKNKDDPEMPEGDLGADVEILGDGRPCRSESWYAEGATFVTLFFSTLDLHGADAPKLMSLVKPVLDQRVPAERQTLASKDIHTIKDARGHKMYSLTFVVGVPDL